MAFVARSCDVSQTVLDGHSGVPRPANDSSTPGKSYCITCEQQSASASVFFTQEERVSEQLVIKILHEYGDTRYSLETLEKRQQCQIEALIRNRVFTPEVYKGLACVEKLDLAARSIQLGEVMPQPPLGIKTRAEYALIMRRLPDEARLDTILTTQSTPKIREHIRFLATQIAHIHRYPVLHLSAQDQVYWGDAHQLQEKLQHNLDLLDLICSDQQEAELSVQQKDGLRRALLGLFALCCKEGYFARRVEGNYIKRCHGDLKTSHIWIEEAADKKRAAKQRIISILDAADFNPSYTNIDVLSDLAMLVIDIQARTGSADLANRLRKAYLVRTHQHDQVSRMVLDYYLLEKAIVRAAVSLVYDNLPELGRTFLKIAETRATEFEERASAGKFSEMSGHLE